MGRKIPAKKHRGVKDPIVQQAKRLESLKGKINAPPKDPDEQPIPKSFTRLFAFQDKDKQNVVRKPRNTLKHLSHGKVVKGGPRDAATNPISQLRKLPGESGRGFSLRINSAVRALHNPCEDLDYPVDIEAEDEKGFRMAEQRERRARKRRKAAKGAQEQEREPHLTRTQKLSLKKKARKMKEVEAKQEKQEVVYERVSFGEVCHGPPSLQVQPKGAAAAARPARRGLLLSALLAPAERQRRERALLPAERQRRERARADAVAAYRALKANKINKQ
ncbi:unnamed protein product [Chrysodeixis includens]|uniref:Coiled-coil domain-containing protein 137 n=1 Tax=Chrysodeixis includens TaxID=689277 RepID=A0A9P0FT99_CHRIL|nr:unnamed protein product [Chrysodeixis includens]